MSTTSTSTTIITSATSAAAGDATPTTMITSTKTSGMTPSPTVSGVPTASGFVNATDDNATDEHAAPSSMFDPPGLDWQTVVAVVSAVLLVVLVISAVMYCKINRVARSEAEALELREARDEEDTLPVYAVQHVEDASPVEEKEPEPVQEAAEDLVKAWDPLDDESHASPPAPPSSPQLGAVVDVHEVQLPTERDFHDLPALDPHDIIVNNCLVGIPRDVTPIFFGTHF